MIIHILKLSPASAGLCIADPMPGKVHSGLRCKIALHNEENEQTQGLSPTELMSQRLRFDVNLEPLNGAL
jgi:hypothetical protein